MDDMLRMWLLGMGILPEQVEGDERLMAEIKAKDGAAAWDTLGKLRYSKPLSARPEFDTPAAKLEFIQFVAGKPSLWM